MPKMNVRTSGTDPLHIAELDCLSGIIGMTFCPGKVGPSNYGKPWDRSLDADIEAIRDWGASAVVTLMEEHELEQLQVANLGAATSALGMEWLHLSIRDVDIPDDVFELQWVYAARELMRRLARGEKILLHCRGGLGRTGLVAACLLIESGVQPADALAKVRTARRGAVETRAQEEYVLNFKRTIIDLDRECRVLGSLLGGAIGDAFGYEIEFERLPEIRRRFGPEGIIDPVLHEGRLIVSDDTQMTLFTAYGLVQALQEGGKVDERGVIDCVRAAYLDWLRTQLVPFEPNHSGILKWQVLWQAQAPGNTCVSALLQKAEGTTEHPLNNSKGCGGVMRVSPLGMVPQFTADQAFELGADCAALTHGHPSGYLSAAALSGVIGDLLGGDDLDEAIGKARARLSEWSEHGETLAAIDHAVDAVCASDGRRDAIAQRQLGEGWIGEEALAIALYAVLVSTSFAQCIRVAANHDGDSDSTASIAGQVWGASSGLEGIPAQWVMKLDVLLPLCEIARGLIRVSVANDLPLKFHQGHA